MPVILKPSKELVDRLGDQATSEIVEWFNTMDASSKDELRALNEQNWARFEARLEQRTTELRAGMQRDLKELEAKVDRVAAELTGKIMELSARTTELIGKVATELNAKTTELNGKITELNGKIDKTAAELKEVLERRLGEQTRWLYLVWAVQGAMIVGLYFK